MSRPDRHADLPMLRGLRDAYRYVLQVAGTRKAATADLGERLAFAAIIADTQAKFEAVGRRLTLLEQMPCDGRGAP